MKTKSKLFKRDTIFLAPHKFSVIPFGILSGV